MEPNYKEIFIEALAEDNDIYAYGSLLAFWEYTENIQNGFTEMPSKDYILEKIRASITKDLEFMETSIQQSKIPAQQIFASDSFHDYIYENTINSLTRSIAQLPVFKLETEVSNITNQLVKVVINERKSFMENFHHNLIINRSIMRSITSSLILCGQINKNTNNDYDFISDKTFEIIHNVFESLDRRVTEIMSSGKVTTFAEFMTLTSIKKVTHSVVNKAQITLSVQKFQELLPVFITELTCMNMIYVRAVHEEKAPVMTSIMEFLQDIERSKNN